MPTVFSDIIKGKIPVHKVAEDERYLAFLEKKPVCAGHTLVIPKQEVDYLFDLSDEELGGLMVFAKKVACAVRAAIPCKKIGVMVAGLEVRHAHVHLIPIQETAKELNFERAREASAVELAATSAKIAAAL